MLKSTFATLLEEEYALYLSRLKDIREEIKNDQTQIEDVRTMVEEMLSRKKETFLRRCLMMIAENQQILEAIANERTAIQNRRTRLAPNMEHFKASQEACNLLLNGTPRAEERPPAGSAELDSLRNLVAVLRDEIRHKDRIIETLEVQQAAGTSPAKSQPKSLSKSPLDDRRTASYPEAEAPLPEAQEAPTTLPEAREEEHSHSQEALIPMSRVLKDAGQSRMISKFFSGVNLRLLKAELIFRGSENHFIATTYHQKCDKVKDTLLLAVSEKGAIFGGYTPIPTTSTVEEVYFADMTGTSFLFSVTHNQMFRLKADQRKRAICPIMSWGPRFGKGSDLAICDRCNTQDYSSCRLGTTYQLPAGMREESAKTLLMGASQAKIREYEVYQVTVEPSL